MKEVQNTKIKIQKTPEKINEIHDLLSVSQSKPSYFTFDPLLSLRRFSFEPFYNKDPDSSGIALFNHKWL